MLIAALDGTSDSVLITDQDVRITYVNPSFVKMSGYRAEDLIGQNPRILASRLHSAEYFARIWRALDDTGMWTGEVVNERADGGLYLEQRTITRVCDAMGKVTAYVAIGWDVTGRRDTRPPLVAMDRERDEITDAIARLSAGATVAETATRIAETLLSIAGIETAGVLLGSVADGMCVVGGAARSPVFQVVGIGQEVPIERARHLLERAAHGPWVEAWTPDRDDVSYASAMVANGLNASLFVPLVNGTTVMGVLAVSTRQEGDTMSLVAHMSSVLEIALVARTLLAPVISTQAALAETRRRIESIIATGGFRSVFQPIVQLGTGAAVGFEALARFDGAGDRVGLFADAHRAGVGPILEAELAQAAVAASHALPDGPWLSINVSPALALDTERLAAALSDRRGRSIVLEITESQPVADYAALQAAIGRLDGDILVAVDDEGAGAANLFHLVELRPQFVKMDRSLVRGIDGDITRQALAVGLLHFGAATECQVIAEGVETEAESRRLAALGMRLGQGYLWGRPMAAPSFRDFPVVTPLRRPGAAHVPIASTTDPGARVPRHLALIQAS